jgi:hypothetical protein
MFEVGKTYKSNFTGHKFVCHAVRGNAAWLGNSNGHFTTGYPRDYPYFTEYKEPVKHIRYLNIYSDGESVGHPNRLEADNYARTNRLARIRVELTEGQFDD